MTIALFAIYTLAMFVFVIIFFIAWYRSRKQVSHYKKFGFLMGAILVGLDLFTIVLLFAAGVTMPLIFILITDTIAFFQVAAFTIMGIHYCAIIGLASFPLLMQKFGNLQVAYEELNYQPDKILEDNLEQTISETNVDGSAINKPSPEILLPKIDMKQYLTTIMTVVAGGVIFSSILFLITTPQLSTLARQHFGLTSTSTSANQVNFLTVMELLTLAFVEELTFRLGIQNFLAKNFGWLGNKYWMAILVTTALWTSGYVVVMDPNWVKLVQVFPFGVALGWLFKKCGIESVIIAHGVFNIVMLIPSQYLISY